MQLPFRSRLLTAALAAALLSPAPADEAHFAEGVTPASGWFDTNKAYWTPLFYYGKGDPRNEEETAAIFPHDDSLLCWAASACNILLHMQQQAGRGIGYASTRSHESGDAARDARIRARHQYAIYEDIAENFENEGYDQYGTIAWYTTGSMEAEEGKLTHRPLREGASRGGYFSSWLGTTPADYREKVYGCHFQNMGEAEQGDFITVAEGGGIACCFKVTWYTELFTEALGYGAVALNIVKKADRAKGHSVTCWGFDVGADGSITKLYITDSDDAEERLLHVKTWLDDEGLLCLGPACDAEGKPVPAVPLYDGEGRPVSFRPPTDYTGAYVGDFGSFRNFFKAIP